MMEIFRQLFGGASLPTFALLSRLPVLDRRRARGIPDIFRAQLTHRTSSAQYDLLSTSISFAAPNHRVRLA